MVCAARRTPCCALATHPLAHRMCSGAVHMRHRGRSRRDRHHSGGSGGTNSRAHRVLSSSFRWRLDSANELTVSRVGGALSREGLGAHLCHGWLVSEAFCENLSLSKQRGRCLPATRDRTPLHRPGSGRGARSQMSHDLVTRACKRWVRLRGTERYILNTGPLYTVAHAHGGYERIACAARQLHSVRVAPKSAGRRRCMHISA